MGGRGKTPVVAYLAKKLLEAGERPAILSRGYGRRRVEDGVVIVSDGVHVLADVDRAGDEPLMLARAVPGAMVLVCEQRAIAGKLAEHVLGATVLLLDDGFQHHAMRRDLDIVIVSSKDIGARRMPFGPLREGWDAIERADAVIVDGDCAGLSASKPTFVMRRQTGAPLALEVERPAPPPGATVVALAAIAQPERFRTALEANGWRVAKTVSFRDHHRYTAADLETVVRAIDETGAAGVLTTEKDAMRLMAFRPLPMPIATVPLTVTFDPPGAFDAWFTSRFQEIRA